MRTVAAFVATATTLFAAWDAHADSYSWGGASGRVDAAFFLSGFNEGAGEGGWDEDSARDFASWTARFNRVTPVGSTVSLSQDIGDDGPTVAIRRGGHVTLIPVAGSPDPTSCLDASCLHGALSAVAHFFGKSVPPPGPRPRLFTLQVFASRSERNATRFARSLDERGVLAEGSFFHEECHPCVAHEAHVLRTQTHGLYRVAIGIFDDDARARIALRALRLEWNIPAFVREL